MKFNNGGDFFNGDMSFFPSLGQASGVEGKKTEMGVKFLGPSIFQPLEIMGTNRTKDEGEGYFGDESKNLSLKLGDEVEEEKISASGKTGYSKLCARGHWRPAEDAKLKELVAQYGPQNWNMIAEHLHGRSGNLTTPFS